MPMKNFGLEKFLFSYVVRVYVLKAEHTLLFLREEFCETAAWTDNKRLELFLFIVEQKGLRYISLAQIAYSFRISLCVKWIS